MLSGEHLSDALSACTGKPADASDMCDFAQARQEVRHLRGVLRRMVLPEESADPSAVRLRVIAVNDVYELDNLPRLANLVKSCSVGYAEELPKELPNRPFTTEYSVERLICTLKP